MPDRLKTKDPKELTLVIATGHDLSLALLAGGQIVAEHDVPMARGHAEAVVPAIAELMAPFGGRSQACGTVVVETGPGSFTGLRVGLAAASALGLAWGAELKGVRSTQLVASIARQAGLTGELLVALAAPRGQVWVEAFAAGGFAGNGEPLSLDLPEYLDFADRYETIVGTAANATVTVPPRASAVAGLAIPYLGKAELLYVRPANSSGP